MKSKFAPTMSKKPAPEEETSEEDDDPHDSMAALHASKSNAHHDLPMKSRTRGTSGTNGNGNGNVMDDVEKNLSSGEKKQK